jgi:hypothetical protein
VTKGSPSITWPPLCNPHPPPPSVAYPKRHTQNDISDIYLLPHHTRGVFVNIALQVGEAGAGVGGWQGRAFQWPVRGSPCRRHPPPRPTHTQPWARRRQQALRTDPPPQSHPPPPPGPQEPFGLTLIEAAAHGVPIVATTHGGPVDIVHTLHNGILVDPTDARGVGDALLRLLTDQGLWEQYATAGRDNINAYSWPSHCMKCLCAIEAEKVRRAAAARWGRGGGCCAAAGLLALGAQAAALS